MKTCERPTRRRQADIRAIRRLAEEWRRGWLAGDADALVSLYEGHPVLMPQGRPAIRSKARIAALYRTLLRQVAINSTGTLQEVEAAGDWGFFWSTYTLTATTRRGGDTIKSRGKSVFVVRRQRDGSWKIARLIDNSDT